AVAIFAAMALVVKLVLDWFLHTDQGLALQATGDNERMIRSFGVNTDRTKIIGLAVSNGLVGLCGAVVVQYQGYANIEMGIGLIIAGLASVIVGQALIPSRLIVWATLAVVVGSVLYRLAIQVALQVGLEAQDMKLISAVLVVIALLLPQWSPLRRLPTLRSLTRSAAVSADGEGR
ncbi:ABC transporter permease, partial [Klebsiella pneumoniae]